MTGRRSRLPTGGPPQPAVGVTVVVVTVLAVLGVLGAGTGIGILLGGRGHDTAVVADRRSMSASHPTAGTAASSTNATASDGGVQAATGTGPLATADAASTTTTAAPVERFSCPATGTRVTTAAQLTAALAAAVPGSTVLLADGVYTGSFVARTRATADRPVYLCGGRGAVLDGGSTSGGYVLHLDGASGWRVAGFTVRNGQKGVMVDAGTGNALQDLLVEETGDEAVHLRRGSTGNVVRGLTIRDTGRRKPKFGEGIYVGTAQSNWCDVSGCKPDASNGNFLLDNRIGPTTAENVDLKEGTTGGVVAGNVLDGSGLVAADSWVDVKGNDWLVEGNRGTRSPQDGFQTHVVVDGWGRGNTFTGNVADLAGGAGVGVYIHKDVPNTVSCTNRVSGGALSNRPCT